MKRILVILLSTIISSSLLLSGCKPKDPQIDQSDISSSDINSSLLQSSEDIDGDLSSESSEDLSEDSQDIDSTDDSDVGESTDLNKTSSRVSSSTNSKASPTGPEVTSGASKKYVINGPEDLQLNGAKMKLATFWDAASEDASNLASKFKEYCNGNIEFITLVYNDAPRKLAALVLSNDSPDVYHLRPLDYPMIMYMDILQSLEGKIDFSDPVFKNDLYGWNNYKWNNEYYVLGGAGVSNMFWFNRQLLRDYGISKDPIQLVKEGKWDWDAMLDIAKKTTDVQSGIYGFGDATGTLVNQLIAGYGEDIVKVDKTVIKNNLSSINVSKAINFYGDLYSKHKVMSSPGETARNLFSSGRLAMFYDGHWISGMEPFKTMNQNGDIVFTHFPKAPGEKDYRYAGEIGGYAIPKGAENIKAACAFLTMGSYVGDPEKDAADWHKTAHHTKEEAIFIDEAFAKNNVLTISYGIDALGAFGLAMGKVITGTPWSTLVQETSPKIDAALEKFMERSKK